MTAKCDEIARKGHEDLDFFYDGEKPRLNHTEFRSVNARDVVKNSRERMRKKKNETDSSKC